MKITGHLVPFPDPGAFDLMSDHLEQDIQATGPGIVVVRVQLPRTLASQPGKGSPFARKRLEMLQRTGNTWELVWGETTDSQQEFEEVSVPVSAPGRFRCKLTNMSVTEAQFSLECAFVPENDS